MLAAVFKGNGIIELEHCVKPQIKTGKDTLIKVIAAGICGSDLHILHVPPAQYAKPGVILCHEYFGVIEELGSDVTGFSIGDRVAVDPIVKCGTCYYCKNGMLNMCENTEIYGQTIDGGFAQYSVVSSEYLHKVPEVIPAILAAQAEPLACVMNGINKLAPNPSNRVLLYGAGPIGLTFLRVLQLYGVDNLVIAEISPERQENAKKCGAKHVIDPTKEDIKKLLFDIWGGLPDIIIDAVGVGAVLQQALELLQCRGKVLIFGQDSNAISQIKPALITRNELSIIGSYITDHTFPLAIKHLSNEKLRLDTLVSHRIGLNDIHKGIEWMMNKVATKVIVFPNGIETE